MKVCSNSYRFVGKRRPLSNLIALLRPSCVATFVLDFFGMVLVNGYGKSSKEGAVRELRITLIKDSFKGGFTTSILISIDRLVVPIIPMMDH